MNLLFYFYIIDNVILYILLNSYFYKNKLNYNIFKLKFIQNKNDLN